MKCAPHGVLPHGIHAGPVSSRLCGLAFGVGYALALFAAVLCLCGGLELVGWEEKHEAEIMTSNGYLPRLLVKFSKQSQITHFLKDSLHNPLPVSQGRLKVSPLESLRSLSFSVSVLSLSLSVLSVHPFLHIYVSLNISVEPGLPLQPSSLSLFFCPFPSTSL